MEEQWVYSFGELTNEKMYLAGGKGSILAYLFQKGYPVPNGFIIMPTAFDSNGELKQGVWSLVQRYLAQIRKDQEISSFAIRSSALSEDSSTASFAGQFKTVLGVSTDDEIQEAIRTVQSSSRSKEVRTYSKEKKLDVFHQMAVVIQLLVSGDISGVFFTADPITGDRNTMTGNYILGMGEALVSGQINPFVFKLHKLPGVFRKSTYEGPAKISQFGKSLFYIGSRLEKELGFPLDIEWTVKGNKLFLLQARPITTLIGNNPEKGQWNDSMTGCYLWSNVNFGEAVPHVMTPITWSVQKHIFETWNILPGFQASGNIGGRIYLNLSIYASLLNALHKSRKDIMEFMEGLLHTRIPESMEIPIIPLSKWFIFSNLPNYIKIFIQQTKAVKNLSSFLSSNPDRCISIQEKINTTTDKSELAMLWQHELFPHLKDTVWYVMGSISQFSNYTIKLRRELIELVGVDDADALLSGISSNLHNENEFQPLESVGPVLGIARVARGKMNKQTYIAKYGHRGPNEFELSVSYPAEDPDWLDRQLDLYKKSPVNVEELLFKKREKFDTAWKRFEEKYPRRAKKMRHRITNMASKARLREAVRSEYVRDRRVARTFVLRASQLTGLGEDVFFLTIDEVLELLSGNKKACKYIAARKQTFQKYAALPPYPSIIRGPFEPFQWSKEPNQCTDIYDATPSNIHELKDIKQNTIIGSAASAGKTEGIVRCLDSPECGSQLQKGEVLVTSQTDIAWTLLFPLAAAIVTDVGAPLSHAAIVARELGIPAVVGCGDATKRLKTGDRILVDGGRGIVTIL
ncbi:MAG: PEP/pyruvate-binding domain-containing protein [Bacillota bacterium]